VRTNQKKKIIAAQFPGEPWKWRADWASGVVRADRNNAIFSTCFAVFWNLISLPIGAAVIPQAMQPGHHGLFFVLIFPLAGGALAIWAWREIAEIIRFGESTFRMGALPGVIGGKLAGVITLPEKLQTADGFHVKLKCTRTVTSGSGKNRHTSEIVVWQTHQDIAVDAAKNTMQSAIPVLFAIPYDMPASDPDAESPVQWRLEVMAKNPGIDLSVRFTVPVFMTAESSAKFKLDDAPIRPYLAKP
jgi:hypothetical protein